MGERWWQVAWGSLADQQKEKREKAGGGWYGIFYSLSLPPLSSIFSHMFFDEQESLQEASYTPFLFLVFLDGIRIHLPSPSLHFGRMHTRTKMQPPTSTPAKTARRETTKKKEGRGVKRDLHSRYIYIYIYISFLLPSWYPKRLIDVSTPDLCRPSLSQDKSKKKKETNETKTSR